MSSNLSKNNLGYRGFISLYGVTYVFIMCLGVFNYSLTWFSISVASPTILKHYQADEFVSAILVLYLGSSMFSGFLAGFLFDNYNRFKLLFIASVGFIVSSILPVAFDGLFIILASRFLQGLFEGVIVANSYRMVKEAVDENHVKYAYGLVSFSYLSAAAIAPLAEALIIENYSWKLTYWMIAGLGLIYLLPLFFSKSLSKEPKKTGKLDLSRLILCLLLSLSLSLASVVVDPVYIVVFLVLACICGFIFFKVDSASLSPSLPYKMFAAQNKQKYLYSALILVAMPVAFIHTLMPYSTQVVFNSSIGFSGYLVASVSFFWSISAISLPLLNFNYPFKIGFRFLILGYLLITASFAFNIIYLSAIGLALVGGSMGIIWSSLMSSLTFTYKDRDIGSATSIVPTLQLASYCIGVAIVNFIVNLNGGMNQGDSSGLILFNIELYVLAVFLSLLSMLYISQYSKLKID